MPTPMILDCDPGHDDAFAIMLAAASPAIDLLAITTVAGNTGLDNTTLNAQRVCTIAGIHDVPIAAGCDRPLVREVKVADDIHGESGLDGPAFGEPEVDVHPDHAVQLMADLVTASDEPVTIAAVGPLTNVATLLDTYPEVASNLARIEIMGGSTDRGNVLPLSEFNIWADPEAAARVLASDVPTIWHGLNVTHQATATDDVLARFTDLDTQLGRVCVDLLTFFGDAYRDVFGFEAPPVHDPVAVAHVIDPSVVECATAPMRIETAGEATRGATVVDLHGVTDWTTSGEVGLHLDRDRFWDLLVTAVDHLGT